MTTAGLLPLSWLYRKIVQQRQDQQKKRVPKKLPVPVISIGNLSVGGTGKTEAVYWVCQQLIQLGIKPGILSRGYKRKSKDPVLVVSQGREPLVRPEEAGDEPYLLARRLAGQAAVVVGKDRYHSGQTAVEDLGCQALVLDDGFQRRFELYRDLDILLFDAGDQMVAKGWVLPAGRCREPLANLDEADCFIVTRSDQYDSTLIEQTIAAYSEGFKPVYYASHEPSYFINLVGNVQEPLEKLKKRRVIAISGIARPKSFYKTLQDLGCTICHHKIYSDHYWYTSSDIHTWEKLARQYQAGLVMTTKDSVKINWPEHSPIEAWALAVEFKVRAAKQNGSLETVIANLVKGHLS